MYLKNAITGIITSLYQTFQESEGLLYLDGKSMILSAMRNAIIKILHETHINQNRSNPQTFRENILFSLFNNPKINVNRRSTKKL